MLYDTAADDTGSIGEGVRARSLKSPGTPRSPSYLSGHSTSAAAATEVLAYFFPNERKELETQANSIGMAQLWAGDYWRFDIAAGARLGRAVARRVPEQVESDHVASFDEPEYSLPDNPVRDPGALRRRVMERRNGSANPDLPGTDVLSSRRRIASEDS